VRAGSPHFTEQGPIGFKSGPLSGIENFVRERDDFIFNSFRNFKPLKRFQNRSDVFEFWSLDNSSSKSILDVFEQEHSGCVGDDLFEISEDHSTESYSE